MRYIVIGICVLIIVVIGLGQLTAISGPDELTRVSGTLSEFSCVNKRKGSLFYILLSGKNTKYYRKTSNAGLSCEDVATIIPGPVLGRKVDIGVYNGDIVYSLVVDGTEVFNFHKLRGEERANSFGLLGFVLFIIFVILLDLKRTKSQAIK